MATPLRVNTPIPAYRGYYVSNNQEQLKAFILETINQHQACRVQIHCTAKVKFKDDVQILHSQNHQHRLLDIAMQDLDLHLEEMFSFVDDPDTFFNTASGGQLLEITNYWALLIKTRHGGEDDHPQDEQQAEEINPEENNEVQIDPFLYVLASTQVSTNVITRTGRRRKLTKAQREVKIVNYLSEESLFHDNPARRINPSSISKWHSVVNRFNIAVWSNRGINLYQRFFDPDDGWIHLRFSDQQKWKHIRSIRLFLRGLPHQHYCDKCMRMHRVTCPNELETLPPLKEKVAPNNKIPITKHSFVLYADFEACQERLTGIHTLSGYTVIAVVNNDVYGKFTYSGIDAEIHFFDDVIKLATEYQLEGVEGNSRMPDIRSCFRCNKWSGNLKGPFRSYVDSSKLLLAHEACWEQDLAEHAVIYFHNFRGYDSHHLLRELIHRFPNSHYLAKTMEKIDSASFTSGDVKVVFKDTYNYFSTSLAALASTILDWKYTPIQHRTKEKNFFPIYWFDDLNKLDEPVPQRQEEWQDMLGNNFVDVNVVIDIVRQNNFHYFKEWHDWYCEKDVWLLLEVFEQFREICFKEENVDPIYFLGAPALSWFLAVRKCHENMYTIENVEAYKLIQRQIRGGVSQACSRHAERVETETHKQEFMYLDVNALYSWCMTQRMPTRLVNTLDELPEGWESDIEHHYLIYGDFESDKPPHDSIEYELYKDMPPMPHKWEGRLCTTFLDKDEYLVSSLILPFWLNHGIKIKKIYKVLKFETEYVLRDYVNNNIEKRKLYPKSDPRNNFYKLLNNSLYGKTCENKFKYRRFVSYKLQAEEDEDQMQNAINMPVKKIMYLTNDEVFIETTIGRVTLDKPIHLGFTVLEWAKLRLFEFWYAIKKHFGYAAKLMYTDTDSLLMSFWVKKDVNIVLEMANNPEIEQFLDLHTDVYESDPSRNQTAGYFSDELKPDEQIEEVIALRAKCYAFRKSQKNKDDTFTLKNKGITRAAVLENSIEKITMEHYRKVLLESIKIRVDQYVLHSREHILRTRKQNKLALTSLDFKRSVCSDGIETKPWDNYVISEQDVDVFDH